MNTFVPLMLKTWFLKTKSRCSIIPPLRFERRLPAPEAGS